MKKVFLTLILTVILFCLFAEEVSFSGTNEFQFISRDRIKSYENYFSDKFGIQASVNNFIFGAEFHAYYPKHDEYLELDDTMTDDDIEQKLEDSEENEYYLDDYFAQYETDDLFLKAGIYEAVIGSGMMFHGYYEDDLVGDMRLTGLFAQSYLNKLQTQLFLGIMENDFDEDENDRVASLGAKYQITDDLQLGANYLIFQEYYEYLENENTEDEYSQRNSFGGELYYYSDFFDLTGEYSTYSDDEREDDLEKDGTAMYGICNWYLGNFSVMTGYKNYENYDARTNDVPTMNYSEEPLHKDWNIGKDEEGFQGEIRYNPNHENEFVVNYAEGWSSNYKVRQSDFFAEYSRDFDSFSITLEYANLEQLNKDGETRKWKKESTPIAIFDFMISDSPVLIKTEYQIVDKQKGEIEESHYEPKIQAESTIKNIAFSLTVEHQYGNEADEEDGDFWIGGEIKTTVFSNTDITLFAGKEKGGLVCRNGVCREQTEFEGLKLLISTSF